MSGTDLERQELARDIAAFAAKAIKEIALLARIAASVSDEDYSFFQAMAALGHFTGLST